MSLQSLQTGPLQRQQRMSLAHDEGQLLVVDRAKAAIAARFIRHAPDDHLQHSLTQLRQQAIAGVHGHFQLQQGQLLFQLQQGLGEPPG